jgi:hypothetical protein
MISFILLTIAGFFNAIMDVLKTRYGTSIFNNFKNQKILDWVNPSLANDNKWKNGDIKQGEKFFGSSTFLVWITDLWHFSKMIMLILIMLAMVLYNPWTPFLLLDGLIYLLAFTITFEISYKYFFIDGK